MLISGKELSSEKREPARQLKRFAEGVRANSTLDSTRFFHALATALAGRPEEANSLLRNFMGWSRTSVYAWRKRSEWRRRSSRSWRKAREF
jgi:hypothetical protein